VAFNIEKKVAVILGTWYGGENKKGIFSLMNYWLPLQVRAAAPAAAARCARQCGHNSSALLPPTPPLPSPFL